MMAVSLDCLSLVIPISVIDAKYPGGWAAYLEWLGNPEELPCSYDEHLFRESAMSGADMQGLIEWWEARGLKATHKRNGKKAWKDMCVIASPFGETRYPCEWVQISEDGYYASHVNQSSKKT